MLTIKEWMEIVNYRITEGSDYGWQCFGHDAYQISSWNGIHGQGGWSANIIFNTKDQTVYEVEVCDYTRDRAYRLINPDYKSAFDAESDQRGELGNQAWDDVDYTDLESDEDWLAKASAIVDGEEYDTRVTIPLDLSEDELMIIFKKAHDADMTFNDYVGKILQEALENEDFVNQLKKKVSND
jgi:hypothetical protein